ncbi:N-terminal domain-containing protein [Cyclospora cayetanensis]|uniref:N-terminal domain-containing protein n=1 Tax=Cyclospora cayetanensis TaxID=88456 RepID=A0A1D3D7U4_9EIME|nr:N-terminal domain-containing protein [Cyclospora cayetanensis]
MSQSSSPEARASEASPGSAANEGQLSASRGPLGPSKTQQPPLSMFGYGSGIGFGLGVTVDWQQLAGVSYRRQRLFDMLWTNPKILETSIVAGAPWGGPLAAVRSERVFQPATTHKLVPELQLFTARGRLIASLPWTFTRLVAMQWNEEEALVCVFADSVVRTFSPAGEKLHFFSLGEAIKAEGGIIQACIGKAGIAVLTSTNQVYINQAFDKARLLHLPTPHLCYYLRYSTAALRGPPLCICAITGPPLPPSFQGAPSSGLLEGPPALLTEPRLLVATEEGALLLVDRNGCQDLKIPDGPFVALAASRSNRFVAAVSNAGALQVLRVDASSVQLAASASFDRSRRVRQIAWCGDDCLGVYVPLTTPSGDIQHLVLLGGPNSEWLPLDFGSEPRGSGGGVVLVEEIDGLRVLTSTTAELIRRAAAATESVFGVGSCDPSAMLCYALERLYAQDAAAEESLRAIKPDLGQPSCSQQRHLADASSMKIVQEFHRSSSSEHAETSGSAPVCEKLPLICPSP